MTIAIAVVTDGRGELLEQTLASVEENLGAVFSPELLIDDSGDPDYARWLEGRFPTFWHFPGARRGLAGAVRVAWETALEDPSVEFVWHQKDDWVYEGPVDVGQMAEILGAFPTLASITLKRHPVSPAEVEAGGQIELAEREGDEFTEWSVAEVEGHRDLGAVTMHRRLFSFNPSLIRRDAIEVALRGARGFLERDVTDALLAGGYAFSYLGRKADPPRVRHTGTHRSPGYRL